MSNILITSAGRRVELVKSFKIESGELDRKPKVFCTDLNPELSSACQVADLCFRAPRVTNKEYIGFLKHTCAANSIALIVPTIDTELLLLSEHREQFLDLGVNIIISEDRRERKILLDNIVTAISFGNRDDTIRVIL